MNKNTLYTIIALVVIVVIIGGIIFLGSSGSGTGHQRSGPATGLSSQGQNGDQQFLSAFTLNDLEGKSVSYQDLKGQPTFIRFSSTTCTICKSENAEINKILSDPPADARFLEINIAEDPDTVRAHQESEGLNLQTLLDRDGAVTIANRVLGTPTHIFLHPDTSVCDRAAGNRLTAKTIRAQLEACR